MYRIIAILLLLAPLWSNADDRFSIELDDETEVDVMHVDNPEAPRAVIWFLCNQGEETEEFRVARRMAGRGWQFYFPDMLSAHFLSPTPSNIARIPGEETAAVINRLLQQTKAEKVYLVGGGRAALPVLKALARPSVRREASGKLVGALLLTPRITARTPVPGEEPVYDTSVGQSRHPLRVLEGERTPNRWGLPHLGKALGRSGSPVSSGLIPGVRGFFWLREDRSPEEQQQLETFDRLIENNLNKLDEMTP